MVSRCGVQVKIRAKNFTAFYSIALCAAKSREISLVNRKLTFDERISCITRHRNFSPRRHPVVSLQVTPFLRDCKGRGYRGDRRAG
ncbi:hypothetical protein pdam_00015624 [Pocillopora damicornis]|uniref:Uncharacterized protein n=1 Tax=Pocillopora damicornis TaxID=46731 RepID=A0A3M6UQN4_POCDA|nr:hypothetical protein pdam_00015624 [Pocillopora damicornis]